jgi:hypothetical protein
MYTTNQSKVPASWSRAANANGNTNGRSPKLNGHSNGHKIVPTTLPESFLDDKAVRTMYGLVPLKFALDWPVFASYDELAGCASWMGGRIPTFEETRSIYAFVESQRELLLGGRLSRKVPAVNG